jgi:hypothetical protein
VTSEDRIAQLQAEADLLKEELEGLYAEKDRVEGFLQVLIRGAGEAEEEARGANQEQMEMLLVMRRVNQLHGPFPEFERWCGVVRI